MAIFEIQINAAAFLQSQRRLLQTLMLCPPPPVSLAGRTLQLQRILFGNNTLRHSEPAEFTVLQNQGGSSDPVVVGGAAGFELQIAQDIEIQVADAADVQGLPNQPAPAASIPLTAVLALEYFPAVGGCYLMTALRRIEWGPMPALPAGVDPAAVRSYLTDRLRTKLVNKALLYNFSNAVPGGPREVENAGVSADPALNRVAFRVSPGGHNDVDYWSYFYKGSIPDRLGAVQWAYFLDSGVLAGIHVALTYRLLVEHPISKMNVTSVTASYAVHNGQPRVTTTISADVHPPDPVGTVHVVAKTQSDYSVGGPNQLVSDIYLPDLKWLIEDRLMAARKVLDAFGFAGRVLGDLLVGGLASFIDHWPPPPPAPSVCSQVATFHQRCVFPMGSLAGLGTNPVLSAIATGDDGMALLGALGVTPYADSELVVGIREFGWTLPMSSPCSLPGSLNFAALQELVRNNAVTWAEVNLAQSGSAPIYVCDWQVIRDPLGVFSGPGSVTVDRKQLPATLRIQIPRPSPQYNAAPYPCDLLVSTSAGVRLVRLAPVPPLTPDVVDLIVSVVQASQAVCNIVQTTLADYKKVLLAKQDDPYPGELNQRYWEIEISGLEAGREVALLDAAGAELVAAQALADMPLQLSVLQSDTAAELSLQLMRTVDGSRAALSGIEFRHQVAWITAVVPLRESCRTLLLPALGPEGQVLAVLDRGVVLLDMADPHHPVPIAAWQVDGLEGAFSVRGEVVAFGAEGLARLQPDRRPVAECGSGLPILDGMAVGDLVYTLDADGLDVRSGRLCMLTRLPVDGGRCLAWSGGQLLVGGSAGIVAYDLSEPCRPRPAVSRQDLDVVGLVTPPLALGSSTVALLADGSAALLRMGPRTFDQIGSFRGRPWFADTLRFGSLLVQVAPDRQSLAVSVLGELRPVIPVQP